MKKLSSRTLLATALLCAAAAVSATALSGPTSTPATAAHSGSLDQHMAQHMAQRTHVGSNLMHLALATQAAPAEAGQQPQGMGHGRHPGAHRQHMQARRAAHHEALKAKLQLTPEQETAWLAFTARMEAGHGMQRPSGGGRTDWSALTTPERLDKMQERMAERQATMAQRFDAIKSFYAALNPEQQKVFDSHHMGGHQRTGMRGGGQHPHRHHHKHHRMDAPAQPQS